MPRIIERILGEIVYSILFAIYGVILMAWFTIYNEVSFNYSEVKLSTLGEIMT